MTSRQALVEVAARGTWASVLPSRGQSPCLSFLPSLGPPFCWSTGFSSPLPPPSAGPYLMLQERVGPCWLDG